MLSLAGIPATAGFIGKIYLIQALVDGGYAWLGVVIVVGSMISLGYYLRVIAAIWMRDAPGRQRHRPRRGVRCIAGGSPEADARGRHFEVVLVAGAVRGGDDLLRHRAPAAVRPRAARRRLAHGNP